MANNPKKMDRAEILAKVLEINPGMRMGEKSTQEMSEYLMQSVRESKQAPKFSDDRFVAVFRGMLGELEAEFDREVLDVKNKRKALEDEEKQLQITARDRIVDFLANAQPGPLSDLAKAVLRPHSKVLSRLGVPMAALSRMIREKSAEFGGK